MIQTNEYKPKITPEYIHDVCRIVSKKKNVVKI